MLLASFVLLRAVIFLNQRGYKAIDTLYKSKTEQLTPDKLCAYEAGLGVYGRSGLIIHPELGNRIGIAVILTFYSNYFF
jgi:epoxyqueuosine reductase QueG